MIIIMGLLTFMVCIFEMLKVICLLLRTYLSILKRSE